MHDETVTEHAVCQPDPVIFETLSPAARACIGGRGQYVTSLCRLPNGELLACPHCGSRELQQVSIWRSADDARSWERVSTRGDELFGAGALLKCIDDGTLLLHTGALYRSADNGVTWTRTACPHVGVVRSIVETSDGDLLMFGSDASWYAGCEPPPESLLGLSASWYREGALGNSLACASWRVRSSDAGRTWSEPEAIICEHVMLVRDMDWQRVQPLFREACVIPLADGRFLAATRRSDPERIVLIESDDGLDWSTEPREFLAPGEIHAHLLPLSDGRLMCTYARTDAPHGIFALISADHGRTWDAGGPVQLTVTLPEAFGWPTSVELPDGSIVTSYTMKAYEETTQINDSLTAVVRWQLPGTEADPVQPVQRGLFPEEHDHSMYCNGITGYTGRTMQHIAQWEFTPAERFQIPAYKGVMSRFPDGELLACPAPDVGGTTMSVIYRSVDNGATWQRVATQPEAMPGKEQAMICLRDRKTALLQTEASGTPLFRSPDRGATWERVDYGEPARTTRNLVQLSDDSVLMFGCRGTYRAGAGGDRTVAWRLRSCDGGLTWERREVSGWDDPAPFFAEAFFLPFSDTHFLAAVRVNGKFARTFAGAPPIELGEGKGDETDEGMVLMESDDGGLHWTPPRWMGLGYSAVHVHMLKLQDGRILAVFRRRFLPFGVGGVFSHDNGKTWDHERPVLLGVRPTCYGGWPTSIQLPDGTMLTTRAYMTWPGATFEVIRWQLPPP